MEPIDWIIFSLVYLWLCIVRKLTWKGRRYLHFVRLSLTVFAFTYHLHWLVFIQANGIKLGPQHQTGGTVRPGNTEPGKAAGGGGGCC